jgi:hypothetical protein
MPLEEVSNPAKNIRRAFEIRIDSISSELKTFLEELVSIFASSSN